MDVTAETKECEEKQPKPGFSLCPETSWNWEQNQQKLVLA